MQSEIFRCPLFRNLPFTDRAEREREVSLAGIKEQEYVESVDLADMKNDHMSGHRVEYREYVVVVAST